MAQLCAVHLAMVASAAHPLTRGWLQHVRSLPLVDHTGSEALPPSQK